MRKVNNCPEKINILVNACRKPIIGADRRKADRGKIYHDNDFLFCRQSTRFQEGLYSPRPATVLSQRRLAYQTTCPLKAKGNQLAGSLPVGFAYQVSERSGPARTVKANRKSCPKSCFVLLRKGHY